MSRRRRTCRQLVLLRVEYWKLMKGVCVSSFEGISGHGSSFVTS